MPKKSRKLMNRVCASLTARLSTISLQTSIALVTVVLFATAYWVPQHKVLWFFLLASMVFLASLYTKALVLFSRVWLRDSLVGLYELLGMARIASSIMALIATCATIMEQGTWSGFRVFVAFGLYVIVAGIFVDVILNFALFYNLDAIERWIIAFRCRQLNIPVYSAEADTRESLEKNFLDSTHFATFGCLGLFIIGTLASYWYRLLRDCAKVVVLYHGFAGVQSPLFTVMFFEMGSVATLLLLILILYAFDSYKYHLRLSGALLVLNILKHASKQADSWFFTKYMRTLFFYFHGMFYVPTMRWISVIFVVGIVVVLCVWAVYTHYDFHRPDY